WNLYKKDADAGNTTWADYPSLGFNKDWIVVNVNMFNNSNDAFNTGKIYVFSKADLYAGGAGTFTLITDPTIFTAVPAITYDNSLAIEYLLQGFNGNSGGSGFLKMYGITGAVGAEAL